MTLTSRTHKLKEYLWQWAVQKSDDGHWFGTTAYRDHTDRWQHVANISFETLEEFHCHVDTFVNGFQTRK